jgi:bis(5'-adenosyl)-triphosphatase
MTTQTTNNTSASSPSSSTIMKLEPGDAQFGKFRISKDSIFYRSHFTSDSQNSLSTIAFVNLRPIVPGHVLVMSERIVPRLSDLNDDEYIDLWKTVRIVQRILEIQHHQQQSTTTTTTPGVLSFNVAIQDGVAAGQSVPHVHVHILPRRSGDYEVNDHVYNDLEQWEPKPSSNNNNNNNQKNNVSKLNVPDDADRRDRTAQEMAQEAAVYRSIVESMQNKSI